MQNQENLEEKLPKNTNKKEICKKKKCIYIWKGEGREKHLEGISSKTAALLNPCFKLPVS